MQDSDLSSSLRLSTSYDGKLRNLHRTLCEVCCREIWVPAHVFETRKYCSRRCYDSAKNLNLLVVECAYCKKEVRTYSSRVKRSKSGHLFCSRACKEIAQSCDSGTERIIKGNYKNGKHESYRSRAIRKFGPACQKCGYKENEKMLDVDHIDGDRKNNRIENLKVLCVWCHALKTRRVL